MNAAQLAHFDLDIAPFDKAIADDALWLPPSKQRLVDELADAVSARRWCLLTGDPGAGKTCVLRAMRHRLPPERFRLTYCHNTTLGRRDFYRQVCHALGLSPKATAAAVFNAIATHMTELRAERIQPVLLIDEAHLLSQSVLDHLHILGNYEWDSAPLLTIVLVGLPELTDQLALRRNRSLYSRLSRRLRVPQLRPDDTADYLRVRLAHAGCERAVFAAGAISLLHEAAGGLLRDLDRLAEASLRQAADGGHKLVERDAVSLAIRLDSPNAA
ncbi:MAG: AAA family ATPase [Planctomycetota bacterium]